MNINWYPGHMAKTKKQIIEDLKLIDVVVELLDARIPLSSQNPDIAKMIGDKKRVVVLNKCDLADSIENDKWINHFRKQGIPAVLTDANSGKGIANVVKEIEKIMEEDLKKQVEKGRVGKRIRVMIMGIPNVGKSSFINRITKKNSLEVGNRPGVTKKKQWIRLSSNIELLDTPGVLWPKFESEEVALHLSYIGSIKDEILDKMEVAFFLTKFLLQNYRNLFCNRYQLDETEVQQELEKNQNENSNILDVMHMVGRKRGAIVSGGRIDEEKVARLLLDEFRSGKIGKITLEKEG
ncbi:MAG: ribosome biogenesis GTPase YlqF [Clostridia bacterium]